MADYYTHFSLIVALPDVAARTDALELHRRMQGHRDEDVRPDDLPAELWDEREGWDFDCQCDGTESEPAIWVHSSNGGVEALCAFLQHLLQKHQPTETVCFEWSHGCSKPRTDAYGGGAACVTATEICTFSTAGWLERTLAELQP